MAGRILSFRQAPSSPCEQAKGSVPLSIVGPAGSRPTGRGRIGIAMARMLRQVLLDVKRGMDCPPRTRFGHLLCGHLFVARPPWPSSLRPGSRLRRSLGKRSKKDAASAHLLEAGRA